MFFPWKTDGLLGSIIDRRGGRDSCCLFTSSGRYPRIVKELGVGVSSFVQKKVEVLAFDLQRQHSRNLTSVGHTRNLVQGNSEEGSVKPKGAWLARVTYCPLPRSTVENANQRDQQRPRLFFFSETGSHIVCWSNVCYTSNDNFEFVTFLPPPSKH